MNSLLFLQLNKKRFLRCLAVDVTCINLMISKKTIFKSTHTSLCRIFKYPERIKFLSYHPQTIKQIFSYNATFDKDKWFYFSSDHSYHSLRQPSGIISTRRRYGHSISRGSWANYSGFFLAPGHSTVLATYLERPSSKTWVRDSSLVE